MELSRLGGALAAILVGPYTGALCVSIVLVVQSLLFADGGVGTFLADETDRREDCGARRRTPVVSG